MSNNVKVSIECLEEVVAKIIESSFWNRSFCSENMQVILYDVNGNSVSAGITYNILTHNPKKYPSLGSPSRVEYVNVTLNSNDTVSEEVCLQLSRKMCVKDETAIKLIYGILNSVNSYYPE